MSVVRYCRLLALSSSIACGLLALQGDRTAHAQELRSLPYTAEPGDEKAEFYWSRLRNTSRGYGGGSGGG
jgi:hypothetical protein